MGANDSAFAEPTTRREDDLTGNETLERDLEHFVQGLSQVYRRLTKALKPGRPFVFTYHHNSLEAYYPIAVALLDAGLVCTTTLPCPAEMGGSIHIHNSESSIVDTVFVCRSTGEIPGRLLKEAPAAVASLVAQDLDLLRVAGVRVTRGDARCVAYGHLVRLAVWKLREGWDSTASWEEKLSKVGQALSRLPSWDTILSRLESGGSLAVRRAQLVREPPAEEWDTTGEQTIRF